MGASGREGEIQKCTITCAPKEGYARDDRHRVTRMDCSCIPAYGSQSRSGRRLPICGWCQAGVRQDHHIRALPTPCQCISLPLPLIFAFLLAAALRLQIQCAMLRSFLSRSPSRTINSFRPPTPCSHSRRLFFLVPKAEHTALVLSPSPSEPGPSTPTSTSSLRSLHKYRSHGLVSAGGWLSSPQYAARSVYPSPNNVRAFHSTPRNQINPLPFLGALLKVSVAQHTPVLIQDICTDLVSTTLAAC